MPFYNMKWRSPDKVVQITTSCIILYLLCFGVAMVFFPIRPFWNDEWRLIYNLKFKNIHQLWGRLDLLQQCPRTYLSVLKLFTSAFDYSYTALRLPALILCVINVIGLFHLKKKLFIDRVVYGCLFILIIISSQTFTDYMTQVKHYEMDILVTLLALGQCIVLLDMCNIPNLRSKTRYLLLCLSFIITPFFSYIYPIAIAPVFLILILSIYNTMPKIPINQRAKYLLAILFPLLLVSVSIAIFYIIDVKQLMGDNSMYHSYRQMLGNVENKNRFLSDFWNLFALVGSGFVFEIIFGILGISAFAYAIVHLIKLRIKDYFREDYLKLYGIILLFITMLLFLSGKLLGGVARLTVYTVPAISFLIIIFLRDMKYKYGFVKPTHVTATIVFVGLVGNIITTCINTFTYPEYKERIKTYHHTSLALQKARLNKVPLLFTDGVHGDIIKNTPTSAGHVQQNTIDAEQINGVDALCTEVILKVNPAYKVWDTIPVFLIPDFTWTKAYMNQLPAAYNRAIATDGINTVDLLR